MKAIFRMSTLFVFVITTAAISIAGGPNPGDTVLDYFKATSSGDTQSMVELMAGPFFESRKTLIEKNEKYPEFLQNYYKGASFAITHTDIGPIESVERGYPNLYALHSQRTNNIASEKSTSDSKIFAVVDFKITFPDGGGLELRYLLAKKDNNDGWRIIDELLNK